MMMNDFETIKLGIGVGDLKFGATRDQARAYLGNPEEMSEDGEANDKTIAWYYWSRGLSVWFDEEENFRFCTCETASPSASLDGHNLVGLRSAEVLAVLQASRLGDPKTTDDRLDHKDGDKVTLIEFQDKGLNLWFENDVLTEIQWGPFIDENDQVIWPD